MLVALANLPMVDDKGIKRSGMFHFSACNDIQLAIGFEETSFLFGC